MYETTFQTTKFSQKTRKTCTWTRRLISNAAVCLLLVGSLMILINLQVHQNEQNPPWPTSVAVSESFQIDQNEQNPPWPIATVIAAHFQNQLHTQKLSWSRIIAE